MRLCESRRTIQLCQPINSPLLFALLVTVLPALFVVLPNEVSAAHSTHNLINQDMVESTDEVEWEVVVFPRDEFGNAVSDPDAWFTLVLDAPGVSSSHQLR